MAKFFQHGWLDVAAGDDRYADFRLGQVMRVEDKACHPDSAAGLGDGVGIRA